MAQQQVGKYQILEVIASGGQATVYLARDSQLGREVALKVLHPHQAQDRQYVERFFREARMAAAINHPNVVVIHDVGQEGELYYIAMEYIPSSLDRLLEQETQPSVDEIVSLVYQIALGLQAAHEQSVVHRDLKPQNVLLTEAGIPKVSDFGIARALEQSTLTSTGMIMGTPFYMSPEQARGEQVDARSDVYSLGCVLYQMLVGTLPFQGTTPYSVIRQHIEEIPQPVVTLKPEVPQWLSQVVERAMAKSPDQRFQNMSEMANALRTATPPAPLPSQGQPVVAPLAPSSPPTSPVASPNLRPKIPVISGRLLAYGGVVILAAVLLIGGFFGRDFLTSRISPTGSPRAELTDRPFAPSQPSSQAGNVIGSGDGNADSNTSIPTLSADAMQVSSSDTTVTPVVSPGGLVAWWPGDEDSTDKAGSNNGTLENGAAFGQGFVNNAFSFDGVDDFVSIPDNLVFNPGAADFTISAWIQTNNVSQSQTIISHWISDGGSQFNGYELAINACGSRTICLYDGDRWQGVSAELTPGKFTHVAMVRLGTDVTFYVNGQSTGNIEIAHTIPASSTEFRIGRTNAYGANSGDRAFDGLIDEVAFHSGALAPDQIEEAFVAGNAANTRVATATDPAFPATPTPAPTPLPMQFTFVAELGIPEKGSRQPGLTRGIAVDEQSNIYVTDPWRSIKLRQNGEFLSQWGGVAAGEIFFNSATNIAVDPQGNIFIVDSGTKIISKIDPNGTLLAQFGGAGNGDGEFSRPGDLTIDENGMVYIIDRDNNRIQKFDSQGNYLAQFGSPESGLGKLRLSGPLGITVERGGQIYVVNGGGDSVLVFDQSGEYLRGWATSFIADRRHWAASDVAVDRDGDIYVVDRGLHRVVRYDPNGNFLSTWGEPGSGEAQFDDPQGIAIDNKGFIYVLDTGNDRIQVFRKEVGN